MLMPVFGLAGLAQAAPLGFSAALERAERESPNLSARAAQIDADRSAALAADALPDPKLALGVDSLPISGAAGWSLTRDSMTARRIALMQEVPNADKRRARAATASATVARSEAERRVERSRVRRETALAWINRHTLERRLALFDELEGENRLLAGTVRAQLAAGRGQAADAVMPRQEAAQLADRRDELGRDLAKAKAVLRRFVGDAADEPLDGDAPELPIDAARLREHAQHHPEIEVFTPQARVAEAQLREAESTKKPDWGVEVGYLKRGSQFGDMVSLQFSFDLPVFSGSRQDPQIAAKRREVDRVGAEREAMLRDHLADLEADLAEYQALSRQLERIKAAWLPLAAEKVDLLLAGYRAGRGEVAPLIAARRELIDQRLRAIDVEGQRQGVAARLHYAYGETEP